MTKVRDYWWSVFESYKKEHYAALESNKRKARSKVSGVRDSVAVQHTEADRSSGANEECSAANEPPGKSDLEKSSETKSDCNVPIKVCQAVSNMVNQVSKRDSENHQKSDTESDKVYNLNIKSDNV